MEKKMIFAAAASLAAMQGWGFGNLTAMTVADTPEKTAVTADAAVTDKIAADSVAADTAFCSPTW